MRCRYCGALNSETELRCGKCQRRLHLGRPAGAPDPYPVVETATAPAYDLRPAAQERQPQPRLRAVAANPQAPPVETRRRAVPMQPALFTYRQPGAVVELDTWTAPAAPPTAPVQRKRSSRRRVSEDQRAFDFTTATPVQHLPPVAHARRPRLMVAPLGLRALAAAFDAGVALAFTALFLVAVRLTLGWLPLDLLSMGYYAGAFGLIFFVYKLAYALAGRLTPGLAGARLELVGVYGQRPTLAMRLQRLFGGCISVAGGFMGLLWAVCDQETLTWHDHISNTFLTTGETAPGR